MGFIVLCCALPLMAQDHGEVGVFADYFRVSEGSSLMPTKIHFAVSGISIYRFGRICPARQRRYFLGYVLQDLRKIPAYYAHLFKFEPVRVG